MPRTEPVLGAVAQVPPAAVEQMDWSLPSSPPDSPRSLAFLRGLTMDLTVTVGLVGMLMIIAGLIH